MKSIKNWFTDLALTYRLKQLMKIENNFKDYTFNFQRRCDSKFAKVLYMKSILGELSIIQKGSLVKTREVMQDIALWWIDRYKDERDVQGFCTYDKHIDVFGSIFCIERQDAVRVCYIFSKRPGIIFGKGGKDIDSLEERLGMKIIVVEDYFTVEDNLGTSLSCLF